MDDQLKSYIEQLREDFMKGALRESDVAANPFSQFEAWLQQAVDAKVHEVQAMNLATVSKEGRPSARTVYLREFNNNGFWFYTNYGSKKAQELHENPNASLTFFWPELERQVRIEGKVQAAGIEESDRYYNARPYESKIGAWASHQSQKISSRQELEQAVEALKKVWTPETIVRPDFWGGYVLTADYYEFWQGRKSRLHDRICYKLEGDAWNISRLAP